MRFRESRCSMIPLLALAVLVFAGLGQGFAADTEYRLVRIEAAEEAVRVRIGSDRGVGPRSHDLGGSPDRNPEPSR